MKQPFEHYISLGHRCWIASDLERMGLRDASYPFDWVVSSFDGVKRCLEAGFDGFLNPDNLFAVGFIDDDFVVKNRLLDISFYHDFSANKSIEEQIDAVASKYKKRISAFFQAASSPTLFVRSVANAQDMEYIKKEGLKVGLFLQRLNPKNAIAIILEDPCISAEGCPFPVFFVTPPKNKKKLYPPRVLEWCKPIAAFLRRVPYNKRRSNLRFWKRKVCAGSSVMGRFWFLTRYHFQNAERTIRSLSPRSILMRRKIYDLVVRKPD